MGSLLSDFFLFIYAVISYWQAYATGGVVTALVGIFERLTERRLTKRAYVRLFIITFLFASFFLAWRDEHTTLQNVKLSLQNTQQELSKELQNIQQELLKEKDRNAPKLDGQIEQVIVSEGPDAHGAQIFIYLSIRNAGSQSIAENFSLDMKSSGFQYQNDPAEFTREAMSPFDLKTSNVTSWDSIKKIAEEPIVSGKVVRGWLRFIVKDKDITPESIRQSKTRFKISFKDYLGQSYIVTYEMPQRSVNP